MGSLKPLEAALVAVAKEMEEAMEAEETEMVKETLEEEEKAIMAREEAEEMTREVDEEMAKEDVEVVRGPKPAPSPATPPVPAPRGEGCSTEFIPEEFREEAIEARLLQNLQCLDSEPYWVSLHCLL